MHLQEARLCLDCEELHSDDRCPRCASDAFAFVTRWIPANERRVRMRRPSPPPAPQMNSNRSRWLTGCGGLAAIARRGGSVRIGNAAARETSPVSR
jgi:hypothetical protein